MFIDSADIEVRSGRGGDGCASFRRVKYIPKGGPDGGNGGDGGSVILEVDPNVETLLDFAGRHHWYADNGRPGQGKQKFGKNAEDLVIRLPPGTQVIDRETGDLLHDLADAGTRVVLARGGKGGLGNERFKSPTNQTPTEATPGEPGQEFSIRLELKLVADVGLVGFPNAGKSTLLSVVSSARPRIADYPFTTLVPQPGVVSLSGDRRMVWCDIPGLIEHAAEGQGLGTRFLRHIERCRHLVHLLDCQPADGSHPLANYRAIRRELAAYSETLAEKTETVVLSKADQLPAAEASDLAERLGNAIEREVFVVSAAARTGLDPLLQRVWSRLAADGKEPREGWSAAGGPVQP